MPIFAFMYAGEGRSREECESSYRSGLRGNRIIRFELTDIPAKRKSRSVADNLA